jgi:hypothetical protein
MAADPESTFGIGRRRAQNVYGVDLLHDLPDDEAVAELFGPVVAFLADDLPGNNWAVAGPGFDDLVKDTYLKWRGQKLRRRKRHG